MFYGRNKLGKGEEDNGGQQESLGLGRRSLFESGKLLGILPDEPKEIRLNESVEELLKRFSNESKQQNY